MCSDQGAGSIGYATHSRFGNSGSELDILVTAMIYMKAEVLGTAKKHTEIAVVRGQDDTKEILVSLKLMKLWNVLHMKFPREDVTSYMLRMIDTNILDKNCDSYYSIQVNES